MLEKNALFSPSLQTPCFSHLKSILIDLRRYGCTNLSFTILFELKKKQGMPLKDVTLETLPCQIEHLWHQIGHLWCQTEHYFQIHIFFNFFGSILNHLHDYKCSNWKFTIPLLTLKAIKLCPRILSSLSV